MLEVTYLDVLYDDFISVKAQEVEFYGPLPEKGVYERRAIIYADKSEWIDFIEVNAENIGNIRPWES